MKPIELVLSKLDGVRTLGDLKCNILYIYKCVIYALMQFLCHLVRYDGAKPRDGYKPRAVAHVVEPVKEKVKTEEGEKRKVKPGKRGSRGAKRPEGRPGLW